MNSSDSIPLANPREGYLANRDEIDQAIRAVLESGTYVLGREVDSFEKEFSRYIAVDFGIGVANGTDAIELGLRSMEVGPNDIVFTVSHTAVATVSAIERAGAIPLLVDIDPKTYTMDPESLEAAIRYQKKNNRSLRSAAIVPVHLYGHPADMIAIMDIAKRHDLVVVEDCAQASGADLSGRKVGAWGDLGAFSFYPTKNLGAFGDGGMIVCKSPDIAEKIRALRQYGWKRRYESSFPGINSRLDEIQAAILRVKLKRLDEDNVQRKKMAQTYNQALKSTTLVLPVKRRNANHVYHLYVVQTPSQQGLRHCLKKHGIGSAVHYPVPVHLQTAYRSRVLVTRHGLSNTEEVCRKILSLPLYPQLTEQDIWKVSSTVQECHN